MLLANFLTAISAASIHPEGFLLEPWSELWKEPDPRELVFGKDTSLKYVATTRRATGEAIALETGEFSWTPFGGLVETLTSYVKGAEGGSHRSSRFRVPQGDGFPDSGRSSSLWGDGTSLEARSLVHKVGNLELEVSSTILSKDGEVQRRTDTSWLRKDSTGRPIALGQSVGGNLFSYDTIVWEQESPRKWIRSNPGLGVNMEHITFWKNGNLVKDSAIFSRSDLHHTQEWKFTRVMECEWSGEKLNSCRQTNVTDSVPDSVVVLRGEDGALVEMWQSLHWMAGTGGFSVHARWEQGRSVAVRILNGPMAGLSYDSMIYTEAGLLDTIIHAQCEIKEIEGRCPDSLVTQQSYDWNPNSIGVKKTYRKSVPGIRRENGRIHIVSTDSSSLSLRLRDGSGRVILESGKREIQVPAIRGILLWELRTETGEMVNSGIIPVFRF
ncbi:MAG: hypothetical protein RL173_2177 [Fibrobacterota bacterium]|jgi:hypothetical protein